MTDLEGKLDRALNSARATVAFKLVRYIFMLMQRIRSDAIDGGADHFLYSYIVCLQFALMDFSYSGRDKL